MKYDEFFMAEMFGDNVDIELDFPTKDKGKSIARRKTMRIDKANRLLNKEAKPYVNTSPEIRKSLKKQSHKKARKGKADRFIRISDMRFYDGLYHSSIYGVM